MIRVSDKLEDCFEPILKLRLLGAFNNLKEVIYPLAILLEGISLCKSPG